MSELPKWWNEVCDFTKKPSPWQHAGWHWLPCEARRSVKYARACETWANAIAQVTETALDAKDPREEVSKYASILEAGAYATESPIEFMLFAAVVANQCLSLSEAPELRVDVSEESEPPAPRMAVSWGHSGGAIELLVQPCMGRTRPDFILRQRANDEVPWQIVVECDGHDFHERTKEQAARDRARDRERQSAGAIVFRFTGSEIHADPFKCSDELINEMIDQFNAHARRQRVA